MTRERKDYILICNHQFHFTEVVWGDFRVGIGKHCFGGSFTNTNEEAFENYNMCGKLLVGVENTNCL